MSNKTIKVQVIGNYFEPMERHLRQNGILFESIISACSPLAMAGNRSSNDYSKFSSSINHLPTLLNIRKNLSEMLSRDSETFCQNYLSQPAGREVRYRNNSEYIIISNTLMGYSLFEKDGIVYSDTWPHNPFTEEIRGDKSYRNIHFPFPDDFNWKYYYDKFIDEVTKEYDHEHIILMRVNSAQWFMDEDEIKSFDHLSSQYRKLIEKMDEYFIEKTNCLCIDEQYSHIPHKKAPCAFTYAVSSQFTYKQYERAIIDIVKNKNIDQYKTTVYDGCPLVKYLKKRFSKAVISDNIESVMFLNENRLTLSELCREPFAARNIFFENISKLKKFLTADNGYTLSDYAIETLTDENAQKNFDIELVELYAEYFKLNINDIIAIYYLYSNFENTNDFGKVISKAAENAECLPVLASKRFWQRNIDYLNNYPYISEDLKKNTKQNEIYIRLENDSYLIIDKTNVTIIQKNIGINYSIDQSSIFDNGYVCSVESADALCSNLAFYIERARRGDGNTPISLCFDSIDKFHQSLNYIDYTDILENEKFVIRLKDCEYAVREYQTVCDLSFLFRQPVRIFFIGHGFNDQIRFYFFAKAIQDRLGGKIYFDDIYSFVSKNIFNGSEEIEKVANEDMNHLFISKRLSSKLLEFVCKDIDNLGLLCGILYNNGYKETVCFSNRKGFIDKLACPTVYLKMGESCNEFNVELINLISNMPSVYMYCYCRLHEFKEQGGFNMLDYIRFPEFTDKQNVEMQRLMLSCDAVVIHFRRGDYVEFALKKPTVSDEGYTVNDFYVEALDKLQKIDDYPNKKYFVFSDDILWVKSHLHEVGLDRVGNSEIYFIDHNKGSDSFKDMQLMMNGKIMIISQSGLATNAAYLNDRCEVLASQRGLALERFRNSGKTYKYDLEPLPRGMFKNWI